MGEEILINFTPMETRVAVIENGMPQEIYVERVKRRGILGNIYLGRVVRVLPGMQAAFVDVGLERAAFIHVDEVVDQSLTPEERASLSIAQVLREGESLLVQVTKDPIGSKGARLTTHISLPSRYLVLMPDASHIGVSQRIEDEEERDRLKQILRSELVDSNDETAEPEFGYILRTVAEGVTELELKADISFLHRLWESIQNRVKGAKAPATVYEDLPLNMRALRDMTHSEIERIRIDSKETFQRAQSFARTLVPEIESRA